MRLRARGRLAAPLQERRGVSGPDRVRACVNIRPSMTQNSPDQATGPSHRFMPLLMLLFIGSGCAALIYEIVWFQMLTLFVGSSAVSLGVVLGTFMGGMCLGSLYLSKFVSTREHPLRVYAMLELGIGVLGILILF